MLVILGNQLFPLGYLPPPDDGPVFMAEDVGLCTYVKHHQQKIVLFLAAMRSYADALRSAGYDVIYHELDVANPESYEDKLDAALRLKARHRLQHFEIEDKPMERRLLEFSARHELARVELRVAHVCVYAGCVFVVCKGQVAAAHGRLLQAAASLPGRADR